MTTIAPGCLSRCFPGVATKSPSTESRLTGHWHRIREQLSRISEPSTTVARREREKYRAAGDNDKGQTPEASPECASKMRLVMRLTAGGCPVSGTRRERFQGAACIWLLASGVSDSHPRNGHSLQAQWYDREGCQGVWRSRIGSGAARRRG